MDTLLPSNIFFFIVSVCMIVLTGTIVIAGYFFLGVLKEVQQLIQSARGEIEKLKLQQRKMEFDGKVFFKVAKLLFSWFVLRRK